ncbi:MAG TPA: tetratricopeptide repeat protein [Pyrinomonadaceae bacterium]|nr:tetratricopeptide repeat protein [Pyrinomonadaceae bacterium]
MKRALACLTLAAVTLPGLCAGTEARQRTAPGAKPRPAQPPPKRPATPAAEAPQGELDDIARLAPAERVERLRAYLEANPEAASAARARELLTVARAALGDERLRASERLAGVELFRAAVTEAPEEMSDKLFFEVVSQLPANLYLLGEPEAAVELAREVESRAASSAPRLLSVAAFYLSVERAGEAARVAEKAVALQPDLAAAHQALGAAYRVGLRLEDAAAAFARAAELDPNSAGARRSLADLLRATGKSEEALALYRQRLEADPQDSGARAGVVLSLFDAGRRAEAERELEAALFDQASNLPLLVGAAYWYASRGEGRRALELAERAVALEPRYRWVWARVAHARALLALNRPLEAERSLRAARELGTFPTLDYELASALAAAGLYDEAAEELARSFVVRNGQIETRLAGRLEARAYSFGELLAPERRAGLFQFAGAETAARERTLKALLALHQATGRAGEGNTDAGAAALAAREFGEGNDALRAYRNLYAATRLAERRVAGRAAVEQAQAAIEGVEVALSAPLAPVALFADELRELRARARESGQEMIVPEMPRERLSKVMRGRIEEAAGWALYNEGQTAEAVVRLRRAVSVLPENTDWWRNAQWRLGAALEASGSHRDALAAYVRSYRLSPDPSRRVVIETLFRRLNNGSANGLEALLEEPRTTTASINAAPPPPDPAATSTPAVPETEPPASDAKPPVTDPPAGKEAATPATPAAASPAPAKDEAEVGTGAEGDSTGKARDEAAAPVTADATAAPTTPERDAPTTTAEPTTTSEPLTTSGPVTTPEPAASPAPAPATDPTPGAPAAPAPESRARSRNVGRATGGQCTLVVAQEALRLKSQGGTATFTATLENYAGPKPPRIVPSTSNWADIIILAEPRAESEGDSARFTVSSISSRAGAFVVSVNSPCGKRQVTVNVE